MSVSEILIRKIKKEDAHELQRISAAITKEPAKIDFEEIAAYEARRAKDASFVAEIDGKIVGYMISYVLSGLFGIEKSAWIVMLGVDPKYMDRGIGKSLAEKVFEFYRNEGITNIFSSVRWDSTDLLSFFKTLGFDRSNFINLRRVLE
jgi:ribosomal protein S18 acetylase RimI-like enzyme